MADTSTTRKPIFNLSPRRHWARCQLHAGIKGITVTSILMKSISTLGGGPGKAERGCWRSQDSMADSSTTSTPILELSPGRHWARHQLQAGIRDVAIASILIKSRDTLGGVLGRLQGDAGDHRTQWQIPPQPRNRF